MLIETLRCRSRSRDAYCIVTFSFWHTYHLKSTQNVQYYSAFFRHLTFLTSVGTALKTIKNEHNFEQEMLAYRCDVVGFQLITYNEVVRKGMKVCLTANAKLS